MKQRDLIALMAASIYAAKITINENILSGFRGWDNRKSPSELQLLAQIQHEAVMEATQLNSRITDEEPPNAY